jgi:hypothetical protein
LGYFLAEGLRKSWRSLRSIITMTNPAKRFIIKRETPASGVLAVRIIRRRITTLTVKKKNPYV